MRTYSLGELASLLGRVEDLIVEDGEVEGEAEPDWVAWVQALRELVSLLVSLESTCLY